MFDAVIVVVSFVFTVIYTAAELGDTSAWGK